MMQRPTSILLSLAILVAALLCSDCGAQQPINEATTEDASQIETAAEPMAERNELAANQPTAELASLATVTREQTFIASLTIFALAIFVGFELITKVPPTLHTPLMSGSNAISGIALVGAALMAANTNSKWAMFFGLVGVILATVNVVGGFMVTDRMLSMFKKK